MLTPDQEIALQGLLEFVARPIQTFADCATVLYASAGCGKTYLTRFLADSLKNKYALCGVAPTHKARKVLDHFLNKNKLANTKSGKVSVFANLNPIITITVASLLSKLREHSYIGTQNYVSSGTKISLFDIFIIDEASMINNEDVKAIIAYTFKYKKKTIFVGDK